MLFRIRQSKVKRSMGRSGMPPLLLLVAAAAAAESARGRGPGGPTDNSRHSIVVGSSSPSSSPVVASSPRFCFAVPSFSGRRRRRGAHPRRSFSSVLPTSRLAGSNDYASRSLTALGADGRIKDEEGEECYLACGHRPRTEKSISDNRSDDASRGGNSDSSNCGSIEPGRRDNRFNQLWVQLGGAAATLTLLFAATFGALSPALPPPPAFASELTAAAGASSDSAAAGAASVAKTSAPSAPVSSARPSPPPPASSIIDASDPPPPPKSGNRRYYTIMNTGTVPEIKRANEILLDHAVGTINSIYYDNSGGINFTPRDLADRWRALKAYSKEGKDGLSRLREVDRERGEDRLKWMKAGRRARGSGSTTAVRPMPENAFGSREGAVEGLRWLVSTLNDPFSTYLTREELWDELHGRARGADGFLGLGAMVEPSRPPNPSSSLSASGSGDEWRLRRAASLQSTTTAKGRGGGGRGASASSSAVLSSTRVENLPIVTAVAPDSPAERAGITVGDRIVAVGSDRFLGSREEVARKLNGRYRAENYVGNPILTLAKPVVRAVPVASDDDDAPDGNDSSRWREKVVGYRQTRVRLPTKSLVEPFRPYVPPIQEQQQLAQQQQHSPQPFALLSGVSLTSSSAARDPQHQRQQQQTVVSGGNAIVHYELLTPSDSIFRSTASGGDGSSPVGYIRLTRFSRSATAGYLDAISQLEAAGATSYIIDVRNNYGGVIQEAMLTASTLLRDPTTVLCYTMNARGGFTPHTVQDFVRDVRYPGYLLSREPSTVTIDQVGGLGGNGAVGNSYEEREDGIMWVPPTSYSSLHEQAAMRGIRRATGSSSSSSSAVSFLSFQRSASLGYVGSFASNLGLGPSNADLGGLAHHRRFTDEETQRCLQKKVVVLINEGTASSAEMFAAALRDNGRTAIVGAKTYGKGLIQHTFPMPDGGALRLTIAEYLTPSLRHVTNVGGARYDPDTGELVGGGIRPDVYCPSKDGIPSNVGADFCVGMALDVLEGAEVEEEMGAGRGGGGAAAREVPTVTIASKGNGGSGMLGGFGAPDGTRGGEKSSGATAASPPKYTF